MSGMGHAIYCWHQGRARKRVRTIKVGGWGTRKWVRIDEWGGGVRRWMDKEKGRCGVRGGGRRGRCKEVGVRKGWG